MQFKRPALAGKCLMKIFVRENICFRKYLFKKIFVQENLLAFIHLIIKELETACSSYTDLFLFLMSKKLTYIRLEASSPDDCSAT